MRAGIDARRTSPYPWRLFWVLLIAGVFSGIGVLPYILALFGDKLAASGKLAISGPAFIAVQAMQMGLFLGVLLGVGLLIAPGVGIRTPFLRRWLYKTPIEGRGAPGAAVAGGVVTGLLGAIVIYGWLTPRIPGWPSEAGVPAWMRVLASLYSGIDEELLMRLLLLGLVLWLLQKISRRRELPNESIFWIANVIVAIVFALSYLPASALLLDRLTPEIVVSILTVKGVSGLVFGYLCWTRGLEAAMLAHFLADLIMHFVGPLLSG